MSNAGLTAIAAAAVVLHLLGLVVALRRRRPQVAARIVLIFAFAILFLSAMDLRFAWPPLDPPLIALVALEAVIAAAAIAALLRGYRWAVVGAWTAFGLHTLLSVLALLFVLTFKINRLI